MFASLLSFTLAALSLQVATASPIEPRAAVNCKTIVTGALHLAPLMGGNVSGPELPVSLLGGAFKHQDYNGDQSSTLLTRGDSEPVVADQFEFAQCDSSFMGYTQGHEGLSYGVLRPKGASKHCVTASAGTLTGAAPKQVWTDSVCPTKDDASQLWSYFSYAPNGFLTFLENPASQPDGTAHKIIVSSIKHGQVQLYTADAAPKDSTVYQFRLTNTTPSS